MPLGDSCQQSAPVGQTEETEEEEEEDVVEEIEEVEKAEEEEEVAVERLKISEDQ